MSVESDLHEIFEDIIIDDSVAQILDSNVDGDYTPHLEKLDDEKDPIAYLQVEYRGKDYMQILGSFDGERFEEVTYRDIQDLMGAGDPVYNNGLREMVNNTLEMFYDGPIN